MLSSFERPVGAVLAERLAEPRRYLQVVAGPRQVGKTTLVRQVIEASGLPSHVASADEPTLRGGTWLAQQWEVARLLDRDAGGAGAVLVLDEVQKIPGWSESVKRLWDEDTSAGGSLRVVVLGSAPLLIDRGLSESLAGRFEMLRLTHWSFPEMRDAFGFTLDDYVWFGGYPGAAPLIADPARWSRYIRDSLIETSISRDVLLMTRVDKPALLRQLFDLGCAYSGQILSYNKMLGQLLDAGNTTTLAHYLELLAGAGMLSGLQKYSGSAVRRRGSSPKLQVFNNALVTSARFESLSDARNDTAGWGRLVESAVGAHLANAAAAGDVALHYWRDGNREVDFVLSRGRQLVAIEVKSERQRGSLPGLDEFRRRFAPARELLVGADGIPVEAFLSRPVDEWFAT